MKRKNFFVIVLLVVLNLLPIAGCEKMKYDNTTNKESLITKEYSSFEILHLKEKIKSEEISFDKFQKLFKVECLRKTHQGYYAILRQEDKKNVFVFFNNDFKLIDIIVAKEFLTKSEFENISINKTTESQILLLDPNAIFLPVSSTRMTAHIVDDGMFVITYSPYVVEGEISTDPTVVSIEYIKNEELLAGTNDIIYLAPVLLPIDKT